MRLADRIFGHLLSDLSREITSLVPSDSLVVCGMLPVESERFRTCLAIDADLHERYAVELPLFDAKGEPYASVPVLRALRSVEQARRNDSPGLPWASPGTTFHGAPVVDGDSFLPADRYSEPFWSDALRTAVGVFTRTESPEPISLAFRVFGFAQWEPSWFRLYAEVHGERLGLDMPQGPALGKAAELESRLTREGIAPLFTPFEREPDEHCTRRLDLRSWFAGGWN